MNATGTFGSICAETVPSKRERREARALAVVKAIQHKKDAPPKSRHVEIGGSGPGVVYFVYSARRIKIGYTADIKARIETLASACPFPLTLLMTVAGDITTEREFHSTFHEYRRHLEWFDASGQELWNFLFRHDADGILLDAELEFEAAARSAVDYFDEIACAGRFPPCSAPPLRRQGNPSQPSVTFNGDDEAYGLPVAPQNPQS